MLSTLTKWFLKDISSVLAFVKNLEAHIEKVVAKADAEIEAKLDYITVIKADAKQTELHLLDLLRAARLKAAIMEEATLDEIHSIETGIAHVLNIKSNLIPSAVVSDVAPVVDLAAAKVQAVAPESAPFVAAVVAAVPVVEAAVSAAPAVEAAVSAAPSSVNTDA